MPMGRPLSLFRCIETLAESNPIGWLAYLWELQLLLLFFLWEFLHWRPFKISNVFTYWDVLPDVVYLFCEQHFIVIIFHYTIVDSISDVFICKQHFLVLMFLYAKVDVLPDGVCLCIYLFCKQHCIVQIFSLYYVWSFTIYFFIYLLPAVLIFLYTVWCICFTRCFIIIRFVA